MEERRRRWRASRSQKRPPAAATASCRCHPARQGGELAELAPALLCHHHRRPATASRRQAAAAAAAAPPAAPQPLPLPPPPPQTSSLHDAIALRAKNVAPSPAGGRPAGWQRWFFAERSLVQCCCCCCLARQASAGHQACSPVPWALGLLGWPREWRVKRVLFAISTKNRRQDAGSANSAKLLPRHLRSNSWRVISVLPARWRPSEFAERADSSANTCCCFRLALVVVKIDI